MIARIAVDTGLASMSSDYILPSEFVLLLVFLFLPPLILAALPQIWLMRRRKASWLRTFATLLITAATSVIAGIFVWVVGGSHLPNILGVQDLWLGHHWAPVLPLAFLVVALAAPIATWLSMRSLKF